MNVLIVYNRDIDVNDAGASRTTIELANYLAEKEKMKVVVAFRILDGNKGKIIERPIPKSRTVEEYSRIIKEEEIDIIIVPEAIKLANILYEAKKGSKAKIISALHTKPGYERLRLYVNVFEDLVYGKGWMRRIKAIVKLILYPVFYYRTRNSVVQKMRIAYDISDKLVLLSECYIPSFIKYYKLKDGGKKLTAIPNGLSFGNVFIKNEDLIKKQNVCLVVGRLDERSKRLSLLLKIWKSIEHVKNDWTLVIVGSGPSEAYYKDLVKYYNLKRVKFEGHQEPLNYYRNSKVFFMTSAFEGQPMTLLEAMPMGCVPVVVSSFEALNEIVEDFHNGLTANNEREFIEKALLLMTDNVLWNKMAINGIQSSKRFERTKTYEMYYSLMKEM